MRMRGSFANFKNIRQLESILLICALVATSMIVIFPLTVPKAKAIVHLASTIDEDGDSLYDMDGIKNGIVLWSATEDHIISDPMGYTVDMGYTLEIPNLNYQTGNPAENVIEFQGAGNRIDVWGTLITNPMLPPPSPPQWTAFLGGGLGGWNGIYFYPGSQGVIQNVLIQNSQNGIVMEPGSYLIEPGVNGSRFEGIYNTGMKMEGVLGCTNITNTNFFLATGPPPVARGMGLEIGFGALNLTDSSFNSHGPNLPSLHIYDANVNIDNVLFAGNNQPGFGVFIEGNSNDTVLNICDFQDGVGNNHYIKVNGSAILIDNNTFSLGLGQLSVNVNDDIFGIPAHVILRNPNPPGITFDNTTIDVTGGSSLTLQWFLDVYLEDPDGHFIPNRQVWVNDIKGNPATPGTKITDASGWARWFLCTEFIQYAASFDNFNHYNKSALNNTMYGYSLETMDMSKVNTIIVPFNPIPNTLPIVTQLNLVDPDPQSGLIDVEFKLMDPDSGDNGSLSIEVFYSYDGVTWDDTATAGPGSSTSGLLNNTLYTFVWDSSNDAPDMYNTTVYLRIIPHDNIGSGTPDQIGPFTLDNIAPDFLTPPTIEVTDTIAWINWTVNESAEASVWYGFTLTSPAPILTTETIGSNGSTFQSVQLTSLQPGRQYTFAINSTDPQGNKASSYPTIYTFKTEIRIYLHKGWNMISLPPKLLFGGTIPNTLISIAGQYDAVQAYYISDPIDPWKHYREGKSFGNDLLDLDELHGFWIHMINDAVLIPDHEDPTTDILFPGHTTVLLQRGWNFVGYPSVANRNVDDALAGVPYDMVQTYDATSKQWLSYDPGGYSTDTLTQMEMGRGYRIHLNANFHMWNVDYA